MYLALVCPSLYIVQKFIGTAGAWVYALALVPVVWWADRLPIPLLRARRWLPALGAVVLLSLVFAAAYPTANVQQGLAGSDDDDALNAGARALLQWRSPYAERTYLGNVLHQLPGLFVIAAPFALLGTSALQNLFWIPAFLFVLSKVAGDARTGVRLGALVFLSPAVLHQTATGTGHIANTVVVVLGLWWMIRTERHHLLAAAFWGVTLASRANFIFVVPVAVGYLWRRRGATVALRAGAMTVGVAVVLSLPFYFAAPAEFGPLEAANRLTRFDELVPHAAALLMGLMGVAALACALVVGTEAALFLACALVQAVPVVIGVLLGALQWRRLDLAYLTYATFAAWFVFIAAALTDRPADP